MAQLRTAERAAKRLLGSVLRTRRSGGIPRLPDPPGAILVVRQHNQLGDMLCAVPLLRSLRLRFPAARITLVTSPVNDDIMRGNRYVDETLLFDKTPMLAAGVPRLRLIARWVRRLRELRPDWAIVPATVSVSFTSHLIARLSGAPVRIGAGSLDGVANPSSFLLTHPMTLDWRSSPDRHQTLRTLDVLAGLVAPAGDLSLEMALTETERDAGRQITARDDAGALPLIAFHPGAGKMPNRWPADRFARVAEILAAEFGARVFITCGPMDAEPVKAMTSALSVPATVLSGRPVREIAGALAAMDLVVTNDTGIMHVAAAVGTPVLSLFGPTDPRQWAPNGPLHRYLRGAEGSIGDITTEEVMRESRRMLARFASRVIA